MTRPDARTWSEETRRTGIGFEGLRTLACVHCQEHFIVTPSITDDDVVLFAVLDAHSPVLFRHSKRIKPAAIPRMTEEVLQHFRALPRDEQ